MRNSSLVQPALLFSAGLWLLVGCSGSGPPLAEVKGKVSVDGQAVPRAMIEFKPIDPTGSPSLGMTDKNGSYRLAFTQDKYGATLGKHTVTITTRKIAANEMPDTGEAIDTAFIAIPKKYLERDALTADVQARGNVIDFDLSSK